MFLFLKNLNYFEKIEVRGLFSFWSNTDKFSTMNERKALAHNTKIKTVLMDFIYLLSVVK